MTHDPTEFPVCDDPAAADLLCLEGRIDEFNAAASGIVDGRALTILCKTPGGRLYAGLHGHTWGGCFELKLLWVAESRRGHGLGSALLHAAEQEARRRNCRQALLTTHSFQAPTFYRKAGYERVAAVIDYPAGHAHVLMRKLLRG